ncbi:MAG: Tim44/TimA family putative adaptor protein [Sphingobium sp.]|nr:Tim44 domain-containing protein [Sphingobium sp.]MCP5398289.1 Tim44 domain-containing protein [Sphingomonas sp.]
MYMIVILALIAAFLALRLYSVLGRRTGHEQQPAPTQPDERVSSKIVQPQMAQPSAPERAHLANIFIAPEAENGIRAIIAADRNFDVAQFIEGARSAYGMILEAFWQGNRDDLRWLCDADVAQSFEEAIAQREADGHVLENRLVRVEKSQIIEASCTAGVAHITLQFDADIAAITRDKDGNVIAGSMSDAVASHDIWTFSRRIGDADPNWKLSETDEAA